ncbi:hypothetical protein D9M69_496860 [compost metagenome]
MPVSRVKAVAAASHQPASVLHSALTVPCAAACGAPSRSTAPRQAVAKALTVCRGADEGMRVSSLFEGAG